MQNKHLLNPGEVAAILGLHIDHVRRLANQGLLKCAGTSLKGHRRYTIEAVREMRRLLKRYRKWGLPVPEAK